MSSIDYEQKLVDGLRALSAEKSAAARPIDPTELLETVDVTHEVGTAGAPVLISAVNASNILRHPDAHPIALDLMLLRHYGPEWMGFDPETLDVRLPEDFKTSVSDANLSKINAVKTLHLVDTFWQRWEVFLWCTMSFNGLMPDFVSMQIPTVAQCLVAIDIANRIRDDMDWSEEIKAYLGVVYKHDGIFLPIPPTEFITLDTVGYPIDVEEIRRLWPEVRASKHPPTGENTTAEQLRRLLIVNAYLEESRAHLQQQLPLVSHAQH